MASKKEKAVKVLGKALKPLTGDALKREKMRKLIAKRKAIQKNVAAKKVRDVAGMAKAKGLAQEGMATAAKKAKAKKYGDSMRLGIKEGIAEAKKKPKPKAAAAGGGKKPPNGNGKKAGAAGGRKRSPEEVRKQQAFGKKKEAIAKRAHRELLKLDEMYYKWDMPNAKWKAKRSAILKKMSDDIDRARPKKK